MTEQVIVGLSGGVDSSVSAMLLKQQGYEVTGVFMKNWEEDDTEQYCSASEDIKDARAICEKLDIPFKKINFADEYWDNVFEHFLAEYQAGRTPNPDILCNQEIKFKAFLEYVEVLGGTMMATGHYARKHYDPRTGTWQLLKGVDRNKDQSYFLYTLSQQQLAPAVFPLGERYKPDVRELAAQNGLVTSHKKDSTGICFIGERRFKDFLNQYLPAQPGDITDEHGVRIGRHDGLMYYTLGQRQGLCIGGVKNRPELPWYVAGKDLENNRLIAVQGTNHPMLYEKGLRTETMHWIGGEAPARQFSCSAKNRYRQPDQPCHVRVEEDGGIEVIFEQSQRALTPGQSVVLYDGEVCLGGGIINTTFS